MAAGAIVVLGVWIFGRGAAAPAAESADQSTTPAPGTASPAELRQQAILSANATRPSDADLTARFAAINVKYFGGVLPPTTVRWEPDLADVGPLVGPGVMLQGMFGLAGSRPIILMNPTVRADPRALDRALCHEMVHAYLAATGDPKAGHGPLFQAALGRLATEGAFEGIAADASAKSELKTWLDTESARIDAERREMDAMDLEIRTIGGELDREIAAFNARAERPQAEAAALEARRQQFNARVLEANDRLGRDRDALAHFNAEVARYNLMMAYPDGLDESSLVPAKRVR